MGQNVEVSHEAEEKRSGPLESREYFVHIEWLLLESTIREYLKNLRHKSAVWEEIFFRSSQRCSGPFPRERGRLRFSPEQRGLSVPVTERAMEPKRQSNREEERVGGGTPKTTF